MVFSWIFFGIWVIMLGLSYFRAREPRKLLTVLEFTGMALLVAMIIVAFASATGRYAVV